VALQLEIGNDSFAFEDETLDDEAGAFTDFARHIRKRATAGADLSRRRPCDSGKSEKDGGHER
jgi:hypothetical protein